MAQCGDIRRERQVVAEHWPPGHRLDGPSGADVHEASPVVLARRILRDRRMIGSFFDDRLFADPALDILLDLFVAGEEGTPICVGDCCVAAAVPATTALRWIDTLKAAGLLREERDAADRRRRLLALTPSARARMAAYLGRICDGLAFAD